MKKSILVFAAIAISAGAFAQTDSANNKMSPPDINNTNDGMNNSQNNNTQNMPVDKSHPDGVMMQNGKMMTVKDGQKTILYNDITMSNGTKIMSDGTCIKKDGTMIKLKEGQHIDKSGNMIPMKRNKDKDMYLVPDSTTK